MDWWIDGGYAARGEPLWMAKPLADAGFSPGKQSAVLLDEDGDDFDLTDPYDALDVRRALIDLFEQASDGDLGTYMRARSKVLETLDV